MDVYIIESDKLEDGKVHFTPARVTTTGRVYLYFREEGPVWCALWDVAHAAAERHRIGPDDISGPEVYWDYNTATWRKS